MKHKPITTFILASSLALLLSGCSHGPSANDVRAALVAHDNKGVKEQEPNKESGSMTPSNIKQFVQEKERWDKKAENIEVKSCTETKSEVFNCVIISKGKGEIISVVKGDHGWVTINH